MAITQNQVEVLLHLCRRAMLDALQCYSNGKVFDFCQLTNTVEKCETMLDRLGRSVRPLNSAHYEVPKMSWPEVDSSQYGLDSPDN